MKLKAWTGYLEIALVIFISVCPYLSTPIKIVLDLILLCFNIKYLPKVLSHNLILFFLLLQFVALGIVDLSNVSANNGYSLTNVMYPAVFLIGALIAYKYTKETFLRNYEKVMFVLAIFSLVGMAINYLAPSIIPLLPSYDYNDSTHRTAYFFNFLYSEGWLIKRNSGIAWEPGVFQFLLNMALLSLIEDRTRKLKLTKIIIYVLAIALTASTTGLIILVMVLFFLIRRDKRYLVILVFAALLLAPVIISILNKQLETKWVGTGSFNYRYIRSVNAFEYGWKYPFGIGSTKYNLLCKQYAIGSFDSYSQILLRYGYGVLICILFLLYKIWKKSKGIAICVVLTFFTEPLWGSLLLAVMYFIYDKKDYAKPKKQALRE